MTIARTRATTCSRCGQRACVMGAELCFFDIEYVTKRVAKAYDAIRVLTPMLAGDRFMIAVRSYVDNGHEGHIFGKPGCPFCHHPEAAQERR